MAKMPREMQLVLAGAALLAALGARPAAAQSCVGDCNGNNAVGSADLTQIIMLINLCPCTGGNLPGGAANGCPAAPSACTAADKSGNGCITAGELTESIADALNGCSGVATATPTPTNTRVATATFTPTGPPPLTSTPTFTPTTPALTSTATPTRSAPPPTVTPSATPTPTTSPQVSPVTLKVGLAPGGGTSNSCRGVCQGGKNNGLACGTGAECLRLCVGGTDDGKLCTGNTQALGCRPPGNCPTTTCANRACVGGPLNGTTCASSANCNGCSQTPPLGSCAIVQNPLFPVLVPLNGVCVPRSNPPGDVACTTSAECKTCVGGTNAGKTCRATTSTVNDCGTGTCTGTGACQLAGFDVEIGASDPVTQEAPLTIPKSSLFLSPALVSGIGTVCVVAGGNGVGEVDCDGGRDKLNTLSQRDHNTNPGNPGNYGARCKNGANDGQPCVSQEDCPGEGPPGTAAYCAGLPDDPTCALTQPQADGSTQRACLEGTRRCVGGVNDGQLCAGTSTDCAWPSACVSITGNPPFTCNGGPNNGATCTPATLACPGGACTQCNTGVGDGPHPGICNSPTHITQSGTFRVGDMSVGYPLAISVYSDTACGGAVANCFGPDGLACTADDLPPTPPSPVTVPLSTGLNQIYVLDASNDGTGKAISPETLCPGTPCIAALTGSPVASCTALRAGEINGVKLGGGFPAFDTTAGDIATTFQFTLEKRP